MRLEEKHDEERHNKYYYVRCMGHAACMAKVVHVLN
jgi:hypothetical protein